MKEVYGGARGRSERGRHGSTPLVCDCAMELDDERNTKATPFPLLFSLIPLIISLDFALLINYATLSNDFDQGKSRHRCY
jgi:hypothetical protein